MNIMSLDAAYGEGATADIQRTVERSESMNDEDATDAGQIPSPPPAQRRAAPPPPQGPDPGFSKLPPQGPPPSGGLPVPLHMQQQMQQQRPPPHMMQGPPPAHMQGQGPIMQGPPPHMPPHMQMQGPPPHMQMQGQGPPPPHMMQGPMMQGQGPPPPHMMQRQPPIPRPPVSAVPPPAPVSAVSKHRGLIIAIAVVVFLFLGVLIAVLVTKPVCAPFQGGGTGASYMVPEFVGVNNGFGLPQKSWHESVSCAPPKASSGGGLWN